MDPLYYSILVGIALVFLLVVVRFALRWTFRLAIICLILLIVLGGAWFWFHDSPHPPQAKPHPVPTQRVSTDRQ